MSSRFNSAMILETAIITFEFRHIFLIENI